MTSGVMVDIAPGRSVFAVMKGPEASPVAVFDAGAFGIYTDGWWVAEALAERGVSTLLFSRAGLHLSAPLPAGETPNPFFHADDLARLLDAFQVTQPILWIGHSMAGIRGHAFAARYPERVGAMVFLDAVAPCQLSWAIRRTLVRTGSHMISLCEGSARSKVTRSVMRLYPNQIKLEGRVRRDKKDSLSSVEHLSASRREILATTEPDLLEQLPPISHCPVGVVSATMVAKGGKTLGDAAKRNGHWTSFARIRGVGHAALLSPKPTAVTADLAWEALNAGQIMPLREIVSPSVNQAADLPHGA